MGRVRREGAPAVFIDRLTGGGTIQIGSAQRGNSETLLIHIFGRGLDDERYVVERFRSMADGEIRPVPVAAPAVRGRKRKDAADAAHAVTSLSNVKQMRPARDEIIVCTAVNFEDSGVSYWGTWACGLFASGRHR